MKINEIKKVMKNAIEIHVFSNISNSKIEFLTFKCNFFKLFSITNY